MLPDFRLKGASGPVSGQTWRLSDETLIGAAEDCQVRITGAEVEGRHARITLLEGRPRIRNLATGAATFVNEKEVSEQALESGDEIRVGRCRLLLQAPGLRPQRVATSGADATRSRRWVWALLGALVAAAGVVFWYYF